MKGLRTRVLAKLEAVVGEERRTAVEFCEKQKKHKVKHPRVFITSRDSALKQILWKHFCIIRELKIISQTYTINLFPRFSFGLPNTPRTPEGIFKSGKVTGEGGA
ncbi:hypothetical protein E2C01_081218 [Portunus trituberculatus]|uniref:Uncharacterized protein n=1 Tax=Portunus trituberculatus TaxID=210409 RepID=A0A5B7IRD2_PORTR|nr:hypothetical protein [Portunus trituberculatus]